MFSVPFYVTLASFKIEENWFLDRNYVVDDNLSMK